MKEKIYTRALVVTALMMPQLVMAQDVAMKIESLRARVMPIAFAVGSLAAVFALILAITSERVGWSWLIRVLMGIGGLAMLNALIMMVRNSLGGF